MLGSRLRDAYGCKASMPRFRQSKASEAYSIYVLRMRQEITLVTMVSLVR